MTFEERIEQERNEDTKRCNDFQAIVASVAKLLGPKWKVEPRQPGYDIPQAWYNERANIVDTDSRKIHFSISARYFDGKVSISGTFNTFNYGDSRLGISFPRGMENPKIAVTMSRGPEAIVKEINRRFLPAYNAAFEAINETVSKWQATYNERDARLARMAKLIGAKITEYHSRNWEVSNRYDDKPHIEVKAYDAGVTITFDGISEELATLLVKTVQQFVKGRK